MLKSIRSLEDLRDFREAALERRRQAAGQGLHITIGMGSCGIAAGALEVLDAFEGYIRSGQLKNARLSETGCIGLCRHEPIVEITSGDGHKVTYGRVTRLAAERILQEHLLAGRVVTELLIDTEPFPTI